MDHVSFVVRKGEIFGFLGPNGAGKTTTINMLTGVTKQSSGSAFISGFDVIHSPVKTKELVGVVPEASFLYNEMSAWDNINFSAKLHNVQKNKRKSMGEELLRFFGLYEKRNDKVGTFSGGMKKRLMIATALMHEPEILFLDEPTKTIPLIIHFAERKRLKVTSIDTVKPTLEDAFVKFTGLLPEQKSLERENKKPRLGLFNE